MDVGAEWLALCSSVWRSLLRITSQRLTQRLNGAESYFRRCQSFINTGNPQHFMEPNGSLPSNDLHPEPDESNLYHCIPSQFPFASAVWPVRHFVIFFFEMLLAPRPVPLSVHGISHTQPEEAPCSCIVLSQVATAKCRDRTLNYATAASSHILSSSFTSHPIVQRCTSELTAVPNADRMLRRSQGHLS
jgi:hypothetical protein